MFHNVVTLGSPNPVVINFGLRGEFEQNKLLSFDYMEVLIGNESYSTNGTPEQLFVAGDNNDELRLKIGETSNLKPNHYIPTIKGYNLQYPSGYEFNSPRMQLIDPIRVI